MFRTMYIENKGAWPPTGFDQIFLAWIGEQETQSVRPLSPAERAAILAKEVIGKRGSQGLLPERQPSPRGGKRAGRRGRRMSEGLV